jgi:hypothetical protein
MSGVLGLTLMLLIVPVAHAQSSRSAAPKTAQAGGPDYAAFVKNGHKPVVTPLDKMTPSSMPFATEISPPIQEPNCAQAPATFNPATASTADLVKYGLFPQPKNESRASWLKKIGWMKHRVCVYYQTNGPKHEMPTPSGQAIIPLVIGGGHTPQEIIQDPWAGQIADQKCGINCPENDFTYTETDADWYIPSLTITNDLTYGGSSSAWVGLGGTGPGYELIQAGSESDQDGADPYYWTNYHLWYEYVMANNNNLSINPVQVNLGPGGSQDTCGEHVYARVFGGNCYELGDIGDQNFFEHCTGPNAAVNTAETIVERNSANGMPEYHSVKFRGVGVTDAVAGYESVYSAWHDYIDDWWDSGWVSTTGNSAWVYDSGDYPYYDYTTTWVDPCGTQHSCN